MKAAPWFHKAALQGHAVAQTKLAELLLIGTRKPRNLPESPKWMRMAAEQGDVHAMYLLMIVFAEGIGSSPNLEKALTWCTKAAQGAN